MHWFIFVISSFFAAILLPETILYVLALIGYLLYFKATGWL